MPSLDIMLYFQDDLKVERITYVNGKNYSKSLEDWLKRMDQKTPLVQEIFKVRGGFLAPVSIVFLPQILDCLPDYWALPCAEQATYGDKDAGKWRIYWRLFYMACSELFNFNDGNEWGVAHVLFSKR